MRISLSFLLIIFLSSCYSKLDKPENVPLMLDIDVNKNLTIAPEAFLENAIDFDFLKSNCEKIIQSSNSILYLKDSSTILIKDNIVTEVHLKSAGNFLNYSLSIGQAKDVFESTFIRLENRNTTPFIKNSPNLIKIGCCTSSKNVWDFEFDNGVLKQVDYVNSKL
jgi:hypothetical protein